MANEGNPGTGGNGEGTTPGTGNGNGEGTQPGTGGAPAGGEPGAAGTGAGTGSPAGGIDRSRLDPALQNMSEDQLNNVFRALITAADSNGGGTQPPPAAPVERPAPPTDEEFREMLDPNSEKYSPNAAFKRYVDANYAPLINDIAGNALEGMRANLRRELPDFDEHQADIDKALAQLPATAINQGVMLDTYLRVKGLKATQELIRKKSAPPSTTPPSPRKTEDEAAGDLSPEEVAIAHRVFRHKPDPVKAYKEAAKATRTIKVPGEA